MARAWRIRFPGAKYHVTSRGNGRARIFLCTGDYVRFIDQLAAALEADQVILYAFCLGFLGEDDDVLLPAMKASRYAIGDERFRAETEDGLLGVRLHQADEGDIVWPEAGTVPLESVISVVAELFGVQEADLRFHGRRLGMIKAVAIDLCCRHSGATQREVARAFGYRDASSVGKRRRALAGHLATDPTLRRQVSRIEKKLNNLKS
jgi:hypothetical protein